MKQLPLLLLAGVMLAVPAARGQGLLAIGQNTDYPDNIPLTFTTTVGGGYDRIEYSSLAPGYENVDSYFIQGGVGMLYGVNDRTTKWNVGLDFGTTYYLEDAERQDDLFYNARLAFNVTHQVSRRLTVSDNFYLTYEIEPDYGIGVTRGRRSGQYLYGYNNASIAYAWTDRVSTATGYTIEGVKYVDDDVTARFEDRLSHIFSQQISYALSRRTKLTAEYRFRYTNYDYQPGEVDAPNPDYTSHYILAGVDQAWSDRLTASIRAGAEFYESDRADEVAPYVEGALDYALTRQTHVRWYVQAGYDGSELGLYDSRYAYRTGLVANHKFTPRFEGRTGLHYVYSDFDGNELTSSASENEINASLGFSYNFWQNLRFDANYSYTTISSDIDTRDYDRHRVNLGINATF